MRCMHTENMATQRAEEKRSYDRDDGKDEADPHTADAAESRDHQTPPSEVGLASAVSTSIAAPLRRPTSLCDGPSTRSIELS